MKSKFFGWLIISLLAHQTLSAQSLERYVVGSAGASASGGNVSVDYTIGETLVQTVSGPGNILTQGFHQPAGVGVSVQDVSAFSYKVFPNPFTDMVQVELNLENISFVQLLLVDLYGRVIYMEEKNRLNAGTHLLPVTTSQLASGSYLLSVSVKENNNKLATTSTKQLSLVR
jgi:hypothetical protein